MSRDSYYRKALKRLKKTDSAMVHEWANSTLWATQAGLDGYRATRDPAALEEAHRGAVGLLAATEVLLDREQGK